MSNDLTVTNTKKVTIVACLTVLAAASATVCSAQQTEIEAVSKPSEPYSSVGSFSEGEIVTDPNVARWVNFQELHRQWQEERGAKASVAEMAMMPAYQKIVGMGPDIVPTILVQLRSEGDRPDHWFWALASITRDNPVPAKSRGKVREMAKAWLEWGEKAGHV